MNLMEHERKDIFKIQKNYKIRKLSLMEKSTNLMGFEGLSPLDIENLMPSGLDISKKIQTHMRKKSYKKSFDKNRKESRTSQGMDVESEEFEGNFSQIKKVESEYNLCDSSLITEDTKSNKSGEKQIVTMIKIEENLDENKFTNNFSNTNLVLSVTNFSSSFICNRKDEKSQSKNTPCQHLRPQRSQSSLVIPNFFQDRNSSKKDDRQPQKINFNISNLIDTEIRDLYFVPTPSNKNSSLKFPHLNPSDNFNEDVFFKFD
jgi:hypothetical protein